MAQRISDPELERHFSIEVDEEDPAIWTCTCTTPGCTHAWDLNTKSKQFKGARHALLDHARYHTEKPALRRRQS